VRLRVSIENSNGDCRWTAIDPFVVANRCGDRPFIVIQPEIRDVNGETIILKAPPLGLAPTFKPGDLMTLNCGEFFGATVVIGTKGPTSWAVDLPPGSYSAAVSVAVLVGDFFAEHPRLLAEEAQHQSRSVDSLRSMLPNQTLGSTPVRFTVTPNGKEVLQER
jgi:hypothetical protein